MQLKLVTVAFDPEMGEFPDFPLGGIEGEILSVVEHFFHFDGLPHLLLVVHHRSPVEETTQRMRRRKKPGVDHTAQLTSDERALYERLRAWRRSRAEADGVPVYVVLNNRQLAIIAKTRPTNPGELGQVEGIGDNKMARYGRDLLRLVASAINGAETKGPAIGATPVERDGDGPGPALARYSIEHSYACWKEKGQHRALRQGQRWARKSSWVLKGDVASFFASVPHARLLSGLDRLIGDGPVLGRLARALAGPRPGLDPAKTRGLPIGALTSQHFANFYLGLLDHWLTDDLAFGKYLRYMDDFLVFGERRALLGLRPRIADFLAQRLGLRLNERRSQVLAVGDGIPFLGFRVFQGTLRVSPDRWRRFRHRQRAQELAYERGELDEERLGETLGSQYAHLQAFDTYNLRRGHLKRLAASKGRGRASLQPGDPGRLLEEQPAERAGREPQQGRTLQAQRQRGVSRRELNTRVAGASGLRTTGPDGIASRSDPLRPGIDQTPVPCLTSGEPCIPPHQGEAESVRPGGGVSRVAAGPISRSRP